MLITYTTLLVCSLSYVDGSKDFKNIEDMDDLLRIKMSKIDQRNGKHR